MKVDELLSSARDTFTVRRVYGDPYEKDGLTVIPAAVVRGGAGGGTGHDEKGQEGEGGGFGMTGRPAGAYVVKDGKVRWLPAVDPTRIFMMFGMAVIAYLLDATSIGACPRQPWAAPPRSSADHSEQILIRCLAARLTRPWIRRSNGLLIFDRAEQVVRLIRAVGACGFCWPGVQLVHGRVSGRAWDGRWLVVRPRLDRWHRNRRRCPTVCSTLWRGASGWAGAVSVGPAGG